MIESLRSVVIYLLCDLALYFDVKSIYFETLFCVFKDGVSYGSELPNKGQTARAEKRKKFGKAYCFWPHKRWRGTARAVHVRTSRGYGRTCGPGRKPRSLRFTCLTLSSFRNLCLIPFDDFTCN